MFALLSSSLACIRVNRYTYLLQLLVRQCFLGGRRQRCNASMHRSRVVGFLLLLLLLYLQLLGEVVQPGDRILVAKGGKGGMGVRAPSRGQKQRDLQREIKAAEVGGHTG
jgi:hypothetical protein